MRFFRSLSNLFFLLTIPSLVFPQEPSLTIFDNPGISSHSKNRSIHPFFDYEGIFRLLDDIESGKIYWYSEKDIVKINQLLYFLAQKGCVQDLENPSAKEELEQDIHELLEGERGVPYLFQFSNEQWQATPAIYLDRSDIFLCRSWVKKAWDSTRHFVKKHKTEIIIGAIVAGAIVAVVVIAGATAGGAVAAAAGAAAAGASEGDAHQRNYPTYDYQHEYPEQQPESQAAEPQSYESYKPQSRQESSINHDLLQEAINESADVFKETIVNANFSIPDVPEISKDSDFLDTARQMTSYLAHETWDAVDQLTAIVPSLLSAAEAAGSGITGDPIFNHDSEASLFFNDPIEGHQKMIAAGHEQIDEIFTTNFSSKYKGEPSPIQFSYGMLPPPGLGNGIFSDAKILSEAGKAADRSGFSKAGRGLMKHGYREGSAFPKPTGNPAQVNEHGQKILETILNHPEKKFIQGEYTRYGKVVDIIVPGVGGARYDINGNFIGFLEP